eukprot:PITA_10496
MAWDENRLVKDMRPRYDYVLFDLDDTLYPLSSGLTVACTKNIADYVNQKLGIEKNRIPYMCRELFTTYGTSMAGLRVKGYEFDYDDYHRAHATKVLNKLGLRDFFEGTICFDTLNPPEISGNNNIAPANSTTAKTPIVCKPSKEAVTQALRLAKADP